jgi:hypothetical protein
MCDDIRANRAHVATLWIRDDLHMLIDVRQFGHYGGYYGADASHGVPVSEQINPKRFGYQSILLSALRLACMDTGKKSWGMWLSYELHKNTPEQSRNDPMKSLVLASPDHVKCFFDF